MDNIYDNPVGSIKKDIYIIKNKVNNKVYIGQSINAEKRFAQHCKNTENSLIGKAIKKHSKENFYFEILESQIENYNEREIYWIKNYNAQVPNGYNILAGGEDPPIRKGDSHASTKLSDANILLLKKDLSETKESLSFLAEKYRISKRQVLRINQGLSRESLQDSYPIRKVPNPSGKLSEEDVKDIIEIMKFSYRLNGEIAKQFNVEVHLISDINKGLAYKQENEDYPIREWKSCGRSAFTYEQVTEIIEILKTTNLSFRAIAKKYNVSHNQISAICYGTAKKYRRKEETYPLRKIS